MKGVWGVIGVALLVAGCGGTSRDSGENESLGLVSYIDEIDVSYCDPLVSCSGIGKINCGAELDGPLYYYDLQSEEIISVCGGACMAPDDEQKIVCQTMCPPAEFICE